MLNASALESQLKAAFSKYLKAAIQHCVLQDYCQHGKSELAVEKAKRFAETFDKLVSQPLASSIANAIDYYVKNAQIYGTIITAGSPVTQVASINSLPTPVTNGKVPNTLGLM